METPIIGFAIYTCAFTGVYCINFPQMDPSGHLSTPKDQRGKADGAVAHESKGFEASRKALEMLGQMQARLHMADGWFNTITRMHKYFRRMKKDYKKNIATIESTTSESDSPVSTRHFSLREGGIGGGLDEFKLIERTLKDFGNLENHDLEMTDVGHRPPAAPYDAIYDDNSASGTTVKSEDGDRQPPPPSSEPRQADSGHWNAINAAPGSVAPNGRANNPAPPTNGQFRPYDAYHRPPQQPQAPPQQAHYAQQINNFRPTFSHESTSAPPPSLTSPGSHTATTASNPSPPFDRQNQPHTLFTPAGIPYTLHPPPQSLYINGLSHPPQMPGAAAYPTPGHMQQSMQPPPPMQEVQQPWNHMEKEAWLQSLNTRFGGDDLAVFTEGGEVSDWAAMAARGGFDQSWLTTIWGPGNPGV